jgi:2-methylcitrate dehydratase PrpD
VTTLEALADFVHRLDLGELSSERCDRLELHLLDTLGAGRAGATTEEGKKLRAVAAEPASLAANVAMTRATEMDDIHVASCTTPGSVVVPAALSLDTESPSTFLAALAAGYELMIRLGLAIDGPAVLARAVWPTFFAAPLGSAAVASRILGLTVEQTAGAFASALAVTSGTAVPPMPVSTSRWLTLGWAAESGVRAAKAASSGILGPSDILERVGFRLAGVEIVKDALVDGLGERYHLDELGLKPYPVARQALAAVEACRELREAHELDASTIDAIVVEVPAAQRAVIDRPDVPTTRFASIVSVQYQAALALCAPEKLLDVARAPVFLSDELQRLMSRVRIASSAELDPLYPRIWPARVTVRRGGDELVSEIRHPRGDPESDFSWDDVIAKYQELDPTLHEEARRWTTRPG